MGENDAMKELAGILKWMAGFVATVGLLGLLRAWSMHHPALPQDVDVFHEAEKRAQAVQIEHLFDPTPTPSPTPTSSPTNCLAITSSSANTAYFISAPPSKYQWSVYTPVFECSGLWFDNGDWKFPVKPEECVVRLTTVDRKCWRARWEEIKP